MAETAGVSSEGLASLEETFEVWDVQSVEYLEPQANGEITASIELDQQEFVLILNPYSMRSENFTLEIQDESGELRKVDPPPSATYRGYVVDEPGSIVAASVIDGQLAGVIVLSEEETWYVEPLSRYDAQAEASQYVIYDGSATIPTDHVCGVDQIEQPNTFKSRVEAFGEFELERGCGEGGGFSPMADELVEVAFDTDHEYYQILFNNLGATVTDMEYVWNGLEVIYQRDTGLCYNITHIIVRTSSSDPYTSNNASTLLSQFRAHWLNNQGHIQRDVAHMFTGRSLNGGTIGIAYLNGICNSYGYGLVQSRYTFTYNRRTSLSAHELGHNWSAGHCDGDGDCHIMCSIITGCNGLGLPNFGTAAVNSITNYKSSRPCLDAGCGEVLDIIEPDPGEVGMVNVISARGADPGESVNFYFGLAAGSTEVEGCSGVYVGIANARRFRQVTADSEGIATVTMFVPERADGWTVYLQAAGLSSCEISDLEVYTFP
jgi:hypothetical protein